MSTRVKKIVDQSFGNNFTIYGINRLSWFFHSHSAAKW